MSAILGKDYFTPLLHRRFLVETGDGAAELELVELADRSTERLENFSLLFRGASSSLPQGTYTVTPPVGDPFPLFLVPVAREADGMRYEAVFNIIIDRKPTGGAAAAPGETTQ